MSLLGFRAGVQSANGFGHFVAWSTCFAKWRGEHVSLCRMLRDPGCCFTRVACIVVSPFGSQSSQY
eukprot:5227063-Amphidinium_carterae.1